MLNEEAVMAEYVDSLNKDDLKGHIQRLIGRFGVGAVLGGVIAFVDIYLDTECDLENDEERAHDLAVLEGRWEQVSYGLGELMAKTDELLDLP
jgi:capsular polysaccharide biosynthesis protein